MKIVDSFCHGKASDRQQLDYIVALSDKLAAAQRELRELSTLLATARYSFRGTVGPRLYIPYMRIIHTIEDCIDYCSIVYILYKNICFYIHTHIFSIKNISGYYGIMVLVEDERIQESNAIGGGDPRDRLTGDIGVKSALLPDAHSRMRVDWNNDRVQRAKRLESQLVAALLKDN